MASGSLVAKTTVVDRHVLSIASERPSSTWITLCYPPNCESFAPHRPSNHSRGLSATAPRCGRYTNSLAALPDPKRMFWFPANRGRAKNWSRMQLNVDFRLIAATSQDLAAAVASGKFREDLYYRLNVVTIALPALRDHREDIPFLVQRFLGRSERPVTIRQDALNRILAHNWPGNVRELENVITRANEPK